MFSRCFLHLLLVNLLLLASLEERFTYRVLGYFLGVGDGDDFKKVLADKTTRDMFTLFWKTAVGLKVEAFSCF